MTNDDGRKPVGAPERSPKAGAGAPSGVDGNGPKRFSVQRKMAVVARLAASRLHGEGYRKLWAGCPRRVRRVMRENGLLAPHRVGRTETKPHDGTIITDKVNEMWGTDMTQMITIREGRANVFVAVEHANSEVVGIHASRSANRFEALEPMRQPTYRIADLTNPNLKPWVKEIMNKDNDEVLAGKIAFTPSSSCMPAGVPGFLALGGNNNPYWFLQTPKEVLIMRAAARGCIAASEPFAPGVARGLKLRHDHGSNYMSGDFQDEIECLGQHKLSRGVSKPGRSTSTKPVAEPPPCFERSEALFLNENSLLAQKKSLLRWTGNLATSC
jgi:transposase InsO family protein